MSSIELNKIFAAILVAGIIAMMAGFISRILIPAPYEAENAYAIEVPEDGAAPAEAEEEEALPEIGPLLASANIEEGQKAFRACSACHTFEQGGDNRVGPNLWNIVDRQIAAGDGFNYSDVLATMGGDGAIWDYEALNGFLAAPTSWAEGTAMSFRGLRDVEDRANMIAWMRTLSDSPVPLPE